MEKLGFTSQSLFYVCHDLAAVEIIQTRQLPWPTFSTVPWPPVDLHLVRTTEATGVDWNSAALHAVLTPSERARAGVYRRTEDARNYIAGRWLARCALGQIIDRAPVDVPIVISRYGRPQLANGGNTHFSISHTDGLAVCAIARGCDVGVDVEPIVRAAELEGTDDMFVSASEQAMLVHLPRDARALSLLALWTLKEAYLKAIGLGVAIDLTSVVFQPDGQGRPQLAGLGARGWQFRLVTVDHRWLLAVATSVETKRA